MSVLAGWTARICNECNGIGSFGAQAKRCVTCNGKGYVKVIISDDNTNNGEEHTDICGGHSQQRVGDDANPKSL